MANQAKENPSGPNLSVLGIKSPMEVIDILAALKIDGLATITDERAYLNPQLKAESVIKYFGDKFGVKPNELPYVASVIKRKLRAKELRFGE